MNILRVMLVLLIGAAGLGPAPAAADHGHIYVKNCDSKESLELCTYD